MSFASELRDELGALPIKPLCCRRAYLYGLLYGGTVEGDSVTSTFPANRDATYHLPEHAASLIHALFSREATVSPITRGAHRYARVSFSSRQAARHLHALFTLPESEAAAETLADKLEFRCEHCPAHFLRGLVVASGTVNDPAKSFHMELKLPNDGRVEPVHILLAEAGYVPGRTIRGDMAGLFFKSAGDIQEVLAHVGATSHVFAIFNSQIERDIRNNENRATNCDAENINRSTRAGIRQAAAIRYLDEQGLLPSLSDDLRATAGLRLNNPEITLAELAELHTPPITKSGLNHRLARIMAFYEKAIQS